MTTKNTRNALTRSLGSATKKRYKEIRIATAAAKTSNQNNSGGMYVGNPGREGAWKGPGNIIPPIASQKSRSERLIMES